MQFNDVKAQVEHLLKRDGVALAGSAGIFLGVAVPPVGTELVIKAREMRPTLNQGKVSWNYITSLQGFELSNSMLFGRHYAPNSGEKLMNELLCRTSGFANLKEGTDYEIVRESFGGTSEKNVVVFLRDIKVTIKDGGTVFLPANNSWNGDRRTVNCSVERANYPLFELA